MTVSRLAPSPTGAQHVGNARTFLAAWLSARSRGGRVILRIEDIDSPRVKPWAVQQTLDDLRWLGLDWDGDPVIQTERMGAYEEALADLRRRELVYPCTCTRSDIAAAASAPHAGHEAPPYPGTCAGRRSSDADALGERPFAWRFRAGDPPGFEDLYRGPVVPETGWSGDFVVWKSLGGPAYQLAVVVDDAGMGVTEVVRGDDLLPSTPRQLQLYAAFGRRPPAFAHVPLVIGPDGRRLAKRHGDTRLSVLREAGVDPRRLVGLLAWSCGWLAESGPVTPAELLPRFAWDVIPLEPFVLTGGHLALVGYG